MESPLTFAAEYKPGERDERQKTDSQQVSYSVRDAVPSRARLLAAVRDRSPRSPPELIANLDSSERLKFLCLVLSNSFFFSHVPLNYRLTD